MKKTDPLTISALGVAAIVILAFTANTTFAGADIWTPLSSCTNTNCKSVKLGGSILSFDSSDTGSWTANLYVGQSECLRLDVVSSTVDVEITAVSPSGTVYQNDDFLSSLPRVVITPAPQAGYYTVRVNSWNGVAGDSDFVLRYGRYNDGNPNCLDATVPSFALEGVSESQKSSTELNAPTITSGSLK